MRRNAKRSPKTLVLSRESLRLNTKNVELRQAQLEPVAGGNTCAIFMMNPR